MFKKFIEAASNQFIKFIKWCKELPYITCPNCGKKGVSFSHEEHFTPGSPDVYHCKFCNHYYI